MSPDTYRTISMDRIVEQARGLSEGGHHVGDRD